MSRDSKGVTRPSSQKSSFNYSLLSEKIQREVPLDSLFVQPFVIGCANFAETLIVGQQPDDSGSNAFFFICAGNEIVSAQILNKLNTLYGNYIDSPFYASYIILANTMYGVVAIAASEKNKLLFEAHAEQANPSVFFPALPGAFFGFLNPVEMLTWPKEIREGNYFPNTIIPAVPVAEPDSDGLQIGPGFYDQVNRLDSDELRKIGVELASAVFNSDDDQDDSGFGTCAHSQSSGDVVIVEELQAQAESSPTNSCHALIKAGTFSAKVPNDMGAPKQLREFCESLRLK